jgi:hypothetical protein
MREVYNQAGKQGVKCCEAPAGDRHTGRGARQADRKVGQAGEAGEAGWAQQPKCRAMGATVIAAGEPLVLHSC